MSGTRLSTMAWRNLWRHRRRTIMTLASIAFGVFFAILVTAFGDGSYRAMIDTAAATGSGHVTVQHPDYLERPALKRTIAVTPAQLHAVTSDRDVRNAVPRIVGETMLATARDSTGAFFYGIDPALETPETLSILEAITEGALFESKDSKGIVLGSKLAETLDLKLKRKVVYTITDKNGEIVSGLARVSGIIETGAPSIDRSICLLPAGAVRNVAGFSETESTLIAVFVQDQRDAATAALRLDGAVGEGASALTWEETRPDLSGFIGMKVSSTVVLEFVIALLIAAGIFNTLFVSVMERLREFGVLMAIGFTPKKLFALVMWESLWLGLVGILLSSIITAYPLWTLTVNGVDFSSMFEEGTEVAGVAVDPTIYAYLYPEKALFIGIAVLVATLLAGIYPAWKAAKVVPVESIRLV